ncbi:BTB/POZ domain-containing protein KCTD21-like [Pristis pectinata]|uniref:BTB/POZ domain-containing protein KCTD21-like n=1 Tax=Pristis pectinata TaxID=685728 RepID=UPI00223E5447|nr:BTB/POZ domain-containing protein KCTD21-like [Pristis pectinata]XP_051881761.1 BTB/POZ domain-containing protein KCTD21-like [Pristis pectinata]XP_051881762.1 BTB/POZ domain-containing protein KCTD21-like [Pristis pectinata]
MSEPITLNVGGSLYTTSLTTLTRYPDSMLGSMFAGTLPIKKDVQGNCFIDRDGKMFRYILNFLRTSHLDLPVDFQELDLLNREADFFQIQPLLEALQKIKAISTKVRMNTILNIIYDSHLHNIGSFTVKIISVQVFSTSCALLKLLSSKFYHTINGESASVDTKEEDQKFISLEWVESGLNAMERRYLMQNWKSLYVAPSQQKIKNLQMFFQQVIKIAVNGGFLLHSFPTTSSSPLILHFTQC